MYMIIFFPCFQSVQADLNGKIFRDLLNFIASAYQTKTSKTAMAEIPTAALLTGLSSVFLFDLFRK